LKVVEIDARGECATLRLTHRQIPVPGAGEVLIRVKAAGVNRPDVLQRLGHYPPPPGASDILGLEVAGEIVSGDLSHSDNRWNLACKDYVCALLSGGGYAEFAVASIAHCLPIPQGWTVIEAASLPETFFTVWSNVFDRARLASGETLLVQGGAGGIGVAAIQMAHALGHRVFATAGTDEKCQACEALGAERAIHYRRDDFVEVIHEYTQGRGVDVILDMVGGDYVPRELKALADEGRLVSIAFLKGSHTNISLREIMTRRLTITGSTLRSRSVAFKADIALKLKNHIWPLLERRMENGKVISHIRPVVHRVFPMAQAAQAHALMEAGEHIGKLVLAW
jgi:NADPH2:quinone reductase